MAEESIVRHTGRSLHLYRQYFGPDLGEEPELILDVGAANAEAGWRISESPLYGAKVIRMDNAYHHIPPFMGDESPAIAGDAMALPFKNQVFDRVISSWMLIHHKRDPCATAIEEMLRVLKDGHEAMIDPVSPFGSLNDTIARRYKSPYRLVPLTMVITKPEGFSDWEPEHRRSVCVGLAKYIVWDKWRTIFG